MMVGNTIAHDTRVLKSALAMADGGVRVTLLGMSPTPYRQDTRLGDVHIIRVPITYKLRDQRLRDLAGRRQRRLKVGVSEREMDALDLEYKQRARERKELGGRDADLRFKLVTARRRLATLRNEADRRVGEWEENLLTSANDWWNEQTFAASWRRGVPEVDDYDAAFAPVIDQLDWDIIHAHDIHHVGTAARAVARRRAAGKPGKWIYDSHEYVAGLPIYPPRTKRLIGAWLDLEKEFIRDADAVITVTAPLADELRRAYSLPATPTVVMNAPVFSAGIDTSDPGVRGDCGLDAGTPLVVYSGGVTRARGVHTVVEAMPAMPGVHLAIVCVPHNRTRPVKDLEELAEQLGVRDRLHLLDPVSPDRVSSYLASADMGVHPMVHFGSHEFALPNKLFEYLHAGLPLAVSDCKALSAFVRENRLGEVFTAENAAECARAITAVLDRKDELHRRIVEDPALLEPYSWNHQAATLRGLYRHLLGDDAVPREPEHETALKDVAEVPAWRDDRPSVLAIGSTDTAGQGWAWAKALERAVPGVGTYVLRVDRGGPIAFPADETVPFSVFRTNPRWAQGIHDRAVNEWTHALIETGRTILGTRYGRDFVEDAAVLRGRGVRTGLVFHGSEIRNPAAHAAREEFSPFTDPHEDETARLQTQFDVLQPKVTEFMENEHGPVFVSTPDLLADVPGATWLPVVVDVDAWSAEPTAFDTERPVVLHAPSRSSLKGSRFVDEVCERLDAEGLITYRRLEGVPYEQMPAHVKQADIVIDQLLLGAYGVAAVEAMAAGRIVVGHVHDDVRAHHPGLPLVEADPATLESVLRGLLADRESGREAARSGPAYARTHHDGTTSARVLAEEFHLHG